MRKLFHSALLAALILLSCQASGEALLVDEGRKLSTDSTSSKNEHNDNDRLVIVLEKPEILAKVINDTNDKDIYDYLPTILAILTVITSTIISYKALKNTKEMSSEAIINQNNLFLSQKRQEWIKDLRPIMSELLGMYSMIAQGILLNRIDIPANNKIHPIKLLEINSKIEEKVAALELHLNFKELRHKVLVHTCKKIDANIKLLLKENDNTKIVIIQKKVDALIKSFTRQSQKILKYEWIRVKSLKTEWH